MITRPLDLASRLRPEPRSFDWLFFVNGGFIVLFFLLFGSRFVLAPGLGLEFRLPEATGATAQARAATHVISVVHSGLILTNEGRRELHQLGGWLQAQARGEANPVLLVRGSAGVPLSVVMDIAQVAQAAGFSVIVAANEPARPAAATGVSP